MHYIFGMLRGRAVLHAISFAFGLAVLSLAGCARDQHDVPRLDIQPKKRTRQPEADVFTIQELQKFRPAVVSNRLTRPTVPSVGLLINTKARSCTAILYHSAFDKIGEAQYVLTNAHCVPLEISQVGASCDSSILFAFGLDVAECDRVEQLETTNDDDYVVTHNDLAVLRLKSPLELPTLPIDRGGFGDGESATVVRVAATGFENRIAGLQDDVNCSVNQSLPGANSRFSRFVLLRGCHIQHGDSGSPVILGGMIRGQVFGSNLKKEAPLAAGNNFACVHLEMGEDLGWPPPATCYEPLQGVQLLHDAVGKIPGDKR